MARKNNHNVEKLRKKKGKKIICKICGPNNGYYTILGVPLVVCFRDRPFVANGMQEKFRWLKRTCMQELSSCLRWRKETNILPEVTYRG